MKRSGCPRFLALATMCAALAVVQLRAQGPEIPKGTNILVGRILDAGTDAPVAGAVVTLTGYFDAAGRPSPAIPRSTDSPGASSPRSVMTNGDGYFVFRDLPAARYSLFTAAFGYLSESYPLRLVDVTNRDTPTVVSTKLSKYAAIGGTVLDERGEPMPGVPVVAMRRVLEGGALVLQRAATEAMTDDRGVYRIAQLTPGRYLIGALMSSTSVPAGIAAAIDAAATPAASFAVRRELIPSGIMPLTGQGVRYGDTVLQRAGALPFVAPDGKLLSYATTLAPGTASPADATVISLASGEQRDAVDLTLRLMPSVRVSGILTGPGGPLKNAGVKLVPPNAADAGDALDPAGVMAALTDAVGGFTFAAVTPGTYSLKVSHSTLEVSDPTTTEAALWAEQTIVVGDAPLSGLEVALRPGLRVSGKIELKYTEGTAIPDVRNFMIGLRPLADGVWRTTRGRGGESGTFLTGGDPPGRYILFVGSPQGWTLQSATHNGRALADDVVDLDNSDLSGLVVTFSTRSTRVTGSVEDLRGSTGADVIVFPADTALWRDGVFNNRRARLVHATSSGTFEMPDLAAGDYFVAAVGGETTGWRDPMFLEKLIAGATRFTLREGETRNLALKVFVPRER